MEQQSNGKSIASMILGICSVVFLFTGTLALIGIACGIVGLILAISVRKQAQEAGQKPDGMSTAGLVLSIIGLAVCVVVFVSCVACVSCATTAGIGATDYYWNDVFNSMFLL
mgnify:CR=1 FL=1